ncbi:LamG domain-containing protein [Phycisphaera mikurensis]|uniref:Beta-agarase n=1 Tax=Phycisphaera mikurensis (strain NBRC 102666 / KCTC 22515 / FYK2301M01) TaxID=1142394 RepID=I0IE52_PHYMF|nr:beta-agarase [Phycisphaera mikurensis]MBB6441345.1 agarase [Phycisphaera mikurensis]BAM03540.1 beta-agarase [Phycisphaera mikurensis NBRC 102666]
MNRPTLPTFLAAALLGVSALAAEPGLADLPVPADAGEGMRWQLDERFTLGFDGGDKAAALGTGWTDAYINAWPGPGRGVFSSEHSRVHDGNLELLAQAVPGPKGKNLKLGVISTTEALSYPVFLEARMRVSPLVLSSNFWLLSEDDVQELDIIECYGTRGGAGGAGGSADIGGNRGDGEPGIAGSNYHMFERDPVSNDVIKDHGGDGHHHPPSDGVAYRDGFHTFGAYWRDPFHVEIYYDGERVRTLAGADINDFDGTGFSRPMRVILDLEEHDWRVKSGIDPSPRRLADPTQNRLWVDWIRVLRPVPAGG